MKRPGALSLLAAFVSTVIGCAQVDRRTGLPQVESREAPAVEAPPR